MVHEIQYNRRTKKETPLGRGDLEAQNLVPGSANNIIIVEDFISQEKVKEWMDLVSVVSWSRGKFSNDAVTDYGQTDKRFMRCAKDQVTRAVDLASRTYGAKLCVYGSTSESVDLGGINRWDAGDSLKLHADSENESCTAVLRSYTGHSLPPFLIMYSALIYLNDDYEGGELCFPLHGIEIKPKPGTLIMFPGNCMYLHEVKEVVSGQRYTHNFFLSNINLSEVYLDMFRMIKSQDTKDSNGQTKATNYY
jgi:predicted 2-oxoglutarate/Fe(II)-dependent dioxygenase YbiX